MNVLQPDMLGPGLRSRKIWGNSLQLGKREENQKPLHGDSQEALLPQPLPTPIEEEFNMALILEDVRFFTQDTEDIAFIDSVCLTTVAGEGWYKNYIQQLPTWKSVKLLDNKRIYKFGGGKIKKSRFSDRGWCLPSSTFTWVSI